MTVFTGDMGIGFGPIGGGGGGGGAMAAAASGNPWMAAAQFGMNALGGILGNNAMREALEQGRSDIQGLPGMEGAPSLLGNFGRVSEFGTFEPNQGFMNAQGTLGGSIPGLLGGGLFNQGGMSSALQGMSLGNDLGFAQNLLSQQMGPTAFGNLQNIQGTANQLGNTFANQVAGGPTDYSGGAAGGLLGAGMSDLASARNQEAVYNASLQRRRNAMAPEHNRQYNKLENRLFAQGRLGSTGGAENLRGLFEAQGQQDLNAQNLAFQDMLGQQNLLSQMGLGQVGQGAGLLGQNLNQFTQNAGLANQFLGLGAGLEGQAFGQQLGALQQNQQAGLQRLQAAQGLFGQGADTFSNQFNLGLGGVEGLLGMNRFGLDASSMPFQLQAGLLGASGYHAQALGTLAQQQAERAGGFFGGLFG